MSPPIDVVFDEKAIDAIFADLDQSALPGAAVGIAIHGRPIYRKGFGLAHMELPVALSPTMRLRIASISKHFTCLAYLLLCEERRADIDDAIGVYFPELHPVTQRVTMRQLMGHVGGLRDAHDICYQFSGTGQAISSEELLSLYREIDDVNAPPGATWNYCNGGYLILSTAIERIAGQSLENFLRERVFEPAGMHDTLLRRFDTDFVPNSATLHMTAAAGGFHKSYLGTAFAGEGGIVSTVDDMLRWLAAIDVPVVGSAATWQMMRTPQRLLNGSSTGYGLGLIIGEYRGVKTLSHVGSVMGGSSHMVKVPAAGLDIIVMTNRHDLDATSRVNRILDACLCLDPVCDVSAQALVSGNFVSASSGRVIQLFAKDSQQIVSIDGFDLPMLRTGERQLRPVPALSLLKQTVTLVGDCKDPVALVLSDFGNIEELHAVSSDGGGDTHAIAGCYRSRVAHLQATVLQARGGMQLRTVGRFGSAEYQLEHIACGIWRARSVTGVSWWGGVLSFDAAGTEFLFTTAGNRALHFRR